MTIEEAQEECKRIFPIGCTYKDIIEEKKQKLYNDACVYTIHDNLIYAHDGGGLLYKNDTFAELISLPKGYKIPKQAKLKKDDLKPLVKLLNEII